MKPSAGSYYEGIDHLRALAAILVFFWHGIHQRGVSGNAVPGNWIISFLEEGWIGVTLFITLTGFIFTLLTTGKDINYFGFLKNRFLRIFPLLFLLMLFNVSFKGMNPNSVFLFFNLLGGGVFGGAWTLVVEFQFYVSYPFLRDNLVRSTLKATLAATAVLSGLFLFFRIAYFVSKGEAQGIAYWTIFGQIDAFLAGILAGLVFLHFRGDPPLRAKRMYAVMSALALIALIGACHWFNARGGFYGQQKLSWIWLVWPTILAILCATLTCFYSLLLSKTKNWLTEKIAYLGAVSYSTYMLHFYTLPVLHKAYDDYLGFTFSADPVTNQTLILLLFHYPITIAVSAASYEIFEKAFLRVRTPYLRATIDKPVVGVAPLRPELVGRHINR